VLEEQELRAWWTVTFFYEIEDCGIPLEGCGIDGYGLLRRLVKDNMDDTFHDNFTFKPAFCEIKNWALTKGWGLPMTAACPPVTSEPTEWFDDAPQPDDDAALPDVTETEEEFDDGTAQPDEEELPDETATDDQLVVADEDTAVVPDNETLIADVPATVDEDTLTIPDEPAAGPDVDTISPDGNGGNACGCALIGG